MRWALSTAVGLLAGCGRVGFEAAGDAQCTFGPFSPPTVAPPPLSTATASQWHPWITADGLSIYFHEVEGTTNDANLRVATRAKVGDPFATAATVTELMTNVREANPTLTADERTIIFDTLRASPDAELMIATRADKSMPFSPPTFITSLNTSATEQSASLTPDGLELFFQRESSRTEIWHAVRTDASQPFASPTQLATLTVAGFSDHHVAIAPDGLDLYMASNRPGGRGGFDVWVAHRPARNAPFAAPAHVPELSSPGDDAVGSLSADGRTLYISFNAYLGGEADMWTATRSCQ